MKFLIDESTGSKVYSFLIKLGIDVKFVTEIMPRADDFDVLEFSEREGRILITNDKDFGELIFRLGRPSSGVILLRLRLDSPKNRCEYISNVINKFSDKLEGYFIVVKEGGLRVRKL